MGEVIGSGSFSVVQRAVCKATGTAWAVKRFHGNTSRDAVLKEIRFLTQLDHKHILRPREYFDDDTGISLITELLTGHDLLQTLTERGSYAEDDCSQIAKRLLGALAHCHSQGIVHRDLKPENVVLACELDPCSVRLVDFGLAGQLTSWKPLLTESCGTPSYAAPEVLQRNASYGTTPDVWAVGVLVYMLLSGAPPFGAVSSLKELMRKIRAGNYHMSDPAWELVSEEAREFVKLLLTVKPEDRPTAAEALTHPWILG
jgi:serine/threonine protein kinase